MLLTKELERYIYFKPIVEEVLGEDDGVQSEQYIVNIMEARVSWIRVEENLRGGSQCSFDDSKTDEISDHSSKWAAMPEHKLL